MEAILAQILSEIQGLKLGQIQLSSEIRSLKSDIGRIETKIDVLAFEGQQDIVAALEVISKRTEPIDQISKEIKSIKRELRTIEVVTAKKWNELKDLRNAEG